MNAFYNIVLTSHFGGRYPRKKGYGDTNTKFLHCMTIKSTQSQVWTRSVYWLHGH